MFYFHKLIWANNYYKQSYTLRMQCKKSYRASFFTALSYAKLFDLHFTLLVTVAFEGLGDVILYKYL